MVLFVSMIHSIENGIIRQVFRAVNYNLPNTECYLLKGTVQGSCFSGQRRGKTGISPFFPIPLQPEE